MTEPTHTSHMTDISIGIIGGSGLYEMAELTDREERRTVRRRSAIRLRPT